MPSSYQGFSILKEGAGGVIAPVPFAVVIAFNADTKEEVTELIASSGGEVAAGSLNVAAGTRVRFRVENHQGLAGSVSQILPATTSANLILRQRAEELQPYDGEASATGHYQDFHVFRESNGGVIVAAPNVAVKVRNADTNAEIADLLADANGYVPAGVLNVATGTRVFFRVENYQGLAGSVAQILGAEAVYSFNANLVLDDRAAEGFAEAVSADVSWRFEDEPESKTQYLASVAAGREVKLPFDFSSGRPVRFFLSSFTEKKAMSEFASTDQQKLFNPNLEQQQPVIWQESAATNTQVQIGVNGYNLSTAKFRKVETSANADMSGASFTIIEAAQFQGGVLPGIQPVVKPSEAAAVTRYFRFSHSSNNVDFSLPSNILAVTFATSGGTGGSTSGPRYNCPALDQFVLARNEAGETFSKSVKLVKTNDFLWNPVSGEFERVRLAEVVENEPLYAATCANGAVSKASKSHPLIKNLLDRKGLAIISQKENNRVLTVAQGKTEESAIVSITPRGIGSVMRIETMGGGHIYASGATEDKMIVCHNSVNKEVVLD